MKMSLLGKKNVHQVTLQGRKPLSAKQRSREALRTPRNDPGDLDLVVSTDPFLLILYSLASQC